MTCSKCAGADAETHETEQHSEDWVNLADARYTGEVIFMPAGFVIAGLKASISEPLDAIAKLQVYNQFVHVDRRIVQAMVDAIIEQDPFGDESVGIFEDYNAVSILEALQQQLLVNPERELE
jgi:hypothetical protein